MTRCNRVSLNFKDRKESFFFSKSLKPFNYFQSLSVKSKVRFGYKYEI